MAKAVDSTEPAAGSAEAAPELRAFLFVDLRGYTRFTQERGDETGARLAARFAEIGQAVLGEYGGRGFELRGDEVSCSFTSTRQALRAAIQLQARFAQETESDPSLPLRAGIGLDAGEVIPVAGGFRGKVLNMAARLCSLAGPGQVLISEGVVHVASKTEGLVYQERGLVNLKGFAEQVRVIQVVTQEQAANPQAALEAGTVTPETSLPIGEFLGALPNGPIVGRNSELERIYGAIDAVAEGAGQLVLLTGERGIGKTRLAQEITLNVRNQGFLVATGRCFEAETRASYSPFREALEMAYRAAPPQVQVNLLPRWAHVGRLLPEELGPTPTANLDPEEEQQRTFRAVAGFLTAISKERPVALLLDDLQWADETSIRLLQHLARNFRSCRILLVATYRDTNLATDSPLVRAVRDLVRERLAGPCALSRCSTTAASACPVVAVAVPGQCPHVPGQLLRMKVEAMPHSPHLVPV